MEAIMKTKTFFTLLLIICTINLFSQIIHVPGDQPTIQAGIDAASVGDIVLVDTGTYYENISFKGKAITVKSHFDPLDPDSSYIIKTIINGSQPSNADSAAVVMFVDGEDTTSILNGFTITGGTGILYTSWQLKYGGGIACYNAGATIIHNIIEGNELNHPNNSVGGGIGCIMDNDDLWLVIQDNKILNNVVTAGDYSAAGGGIYLLSHARIYNNEIVNNHCICESGTAEGGGIEIQTLLSVPKEVYFIDNIIRYNTLDGPEAMGGGIASLNSEIHIINNIISDNNIIGNYCNGGGIYSISDMVNITCKTEIIGNYISHNYTSAEESGSGAGLCFINPIGQFKVNNNEIIENGDINECDAGAGIYIKDAEETEFLINGNIIKNNTAGVGAGLDVINTYNLSLSNNLFLENNVLGSGGAIALWQTSTKKDQVKSSYKSNHVALINNTFYSNTAEINGGAIRCTYNDIKLVILNCIFWDNEATGLGNDINYSGMDTIFISYSDINSDSIIGNWNGIWNIYEDPLFTDTLGHLDNCESPCVNAGIDALEVNGIWHYAPLIDIDSDDRPYENTFPDIGADETPCLETSVKNSGDELSQTSLNNFPNPFNNKTTIEINIQQTDFVRLSIVNFTGKEIQTLVSEYLHHGLHQFEWNADGLPAGIYFLRLETNGISETKKLVLLR